MKTKTRIISLIIAAFILFPLFFQLLVPISAHASGQVISISNASDLIAFSKKCSYDSWSVGKRVILTSDISLEGKDFEPIPSFSGIFDGQGHVISGLVIDRAYSPAGLFSKVEKDGEVINLTVTGSVMPDGEGTTVGGIVGENHGKIENCVFSGSVVGKADVGGIAGANRISGSIINCKSEGEIICESRAGGISGINEGIISASQNSAKVNTISISSSLSLDDINFPLTLDITKLFSIDSSAMTDAGGICGYSIGIITNCTNDGTVGYPHIGYNVGGIAGRSCGHMSGNINNAEINGRKDVGGIVGQIEPYVSYRLSAGLLEELKTELNALTGDINGILSSADGGTSKVSQALTNLIKAVTEATVTTEIISRDLGNYSTDVLLEVNRASIILKDVASMLAEATEQMPSFIDLLSQGLDKLSKAIYSINDAANIAGGSLYEISSSISKTAEELKSSISLSEEAKNKILDAVSKLQEGESLDESDIASAILLITEGYTDLVKALEIIENSFPTLEKSLSDLGNAGEKATEGSKYIADALSVFSQALVILSDVSSNVNDLIVYISQVDPIQIPALPEKLSDTVIDLFVQIITVELEFKNLSDEITSLSKDVIAKIGKINDRINRISNDIINEMYSLGEDFVNDEVNENEIGEITSGKIFSCINNGSVFGDKNVGGIGGAMGIEYSIDPEDDFSLEISLAQKKSYQLKAVIHACTNNGKVTSKYDAVGGVCGKMDLGLIYGCESYCEVESTDGSYVGGIAGISAGLISQCYAKCTLSGKNYVGGIVGSGVAKDYYGDSSIVRNCYSMVMIDRYAQYAGAIAGANLGKFSENLFISDTLAGIDRVSYAGKAEPISYEELTKRRVLPAGFYSFTLRFEADGKIIHSVNFNYGDSFDSSIFPEISSKDGYYGHWDKTDLSSLHFDTTVSVIYKAYATAIGSDEKRDNGREIFFTQGEFKEDDKLIINQNSNASGLVLKDNFFTKNTLIECWTITLPNAAVDTNMMHFLPTTSECRIFVKENGAWKQVDAEKFGSYLCFEITGETAEIAVVAHRVNMLPIIILSSIAVLSIGGLTALIIIKKRKAEPSPETN